MDATTGSDRAVVAGVDGSERALQAVRWAAAEASRRRVMLRLVSAYVVVGSRSRGGLSSRLFGSVSRAVLHQAHCPVAVVHPGAGG